MIEAAFLALVIAVHDGDSIRVRSDNGIRVVRIARIDAPELAQEWGRVSRDALRRQCLGAQAWVQPTATDRYGRTVANVACRNGVDVSTRQVERGMAWVFIRYEPAGGRLDHHQARAQKHRRGLWRAAAPIAPWDYRMSLRKGWAAGTGRP